MKSFLDKLLATLQDASVSKDATVMKRYMKNQFEFYGIRAPQRRKIMQTVLKKYPITLDSLDQTISKLYEQPHREAQYVAVDLLGFYARRGRLDASRIALIEQLIRHKIHGGTP